jgi:hypothetical protein
MGLKRPKLGVAIFCLSATYTAHAAPVIESNDRLEVNWSTLRLRYYGEATSGSGTEDLKSAEKKAWRDGLNYANDVVRNLNIAANEQFSQTAEKLAEDAKLAAHQVSTGTSSVSTTYFADGTVRVHLESALPKALESSVIHFRQKEAPEPTMTEHTGIVLAPDHGVKPRPNYQVTDEDGKVLFDVRDMAQASYSRRLMGRWFRKPTQAELVEAVGKNPLTIPVQVKDGKFLVQREIWDKATDGHKSLLVSGIIAIALP